MINNKKQRKKSRGQIANDKKQKTRTNDKCQMTNDK